MEALYDQRGQVYAWLQEDSGRIISLRGEHVAFIDGDNVYNCHGQHLGWWDHGHMRDRHGAVVVFTSRATGMIVGRPGLAGRPGVPGIAGMPGRPGLTGVPGRPRNAGVWTSRMPF